MFLNSEIAYMEKILARQESHSLGRYGFFMNTPEFQVKQQEIKAAEKPPSMKKFTLKARQPDMINCYTSDVLGRKKRSKKIKRSAKPSPAKASPARVRRSRSAKKSGKKRSSKRSASETKAKFDFARISPDNVQVLLRVARSRATIARKQLKEVKTMTKDNAARREQLEARGEYLEYKRAKADLLDMIRRINILEPLLEGMGSAGADTGDSSAALPQLGGAGKGEQVMDDEIFSRLDALLAVERDMVELRKQLRAERLAIKHAEKRSAIASETNDKEYQEYLNREAGLQQERTRLRERLTAVKKLNEIPSEVFTARLDRKLIDIKRGIAVSRQRLDEQKRESKAKITRARKLLAQTREETKSEAKKAKELAASLKTERGKEPNPEFLKRALAEKAAAEGARALASQLKTLEKQKKSLVAETQRLDRKLLDMDSMLPLNDKDLHKAVSMIFREAFKVAPGTKKLTVREMKEMLRAHQRKVLLETVEKARANKPKCYLTAKWTAFEVKNTLRVSHDSRLIRFRLPEGVSLNLPVCSCLLVKAPEGKYEGVVRPYTPVSDNHLTGGFELLVKVYPKGKCSQYLGNVTIGARVEMKHIPVNVKFQYPFGLKSIIMLAGGTGITPCFQALRRMFRKGNDDSTKVTLISGNRTQRDILLREMLDNMVAARPKQFKVVHVLSNEREGSSWKGRRGFITADVIREECNVEPHKDQMVFVCGPPPMYAALSGPRKAKELTGVLAELGYKADQVVKF